MVNEPQEKTVSTPESEPKANLLKASERGTKHREGGRTKDVRICTRGTSKQELILGLAGLLESLYLNYILLIIELETGPDSDARDKFGCTPQLIYG